VLRARVIGELWATRKSPGLAGQKLLLLAPLGAGGPTGTVWVAIDTLDAGPGDEVLCAFGSGARNVLRPGPDNRDLLVDAAVAEIIWRGGPPATPGE
jgi:microcompartment protein CcmK/EutM